jgi:hypothetical protein
MNASNFQPATKANWAKNGNYHPGKVWHHQTRQNLGRCSKRQGVPLRCSRQMVHSCGFGSRARYGPAGAFYPKDILRNFAAARKSSARPSLKSAGCADDSLLIDYGSGI